MGWSWGSLRGSRRSETFGLHRDLSLAKDVDMVITDGSRFLREELKKRKLTLTACAIALRVKVPTIHSWVSGKKRPRSEYRDAIEAIFGVPANAWKTEADLALMTRPDESGPIPEAPAATGTDDV